MLGHFVRTLGFMVAFLATVALLATVLYWTIQSETRVAVFAVVMVTGILIVLFRGFWEMTR